MKWLIDLAGRLAGARTEVVPHDHLQAALDFFAIDRAGGLTRLEDAICVLVAKDRFDLTTLFFREDELLVFEFDVVHVQEYLEDSAAAHGCTRIGVPVDDTVVVTVHACTSKVGVDEAAVGITLFCVALQLEPFAADIKSVGDVPVVAHRRVGGISCWPALACVDDQGEAQDNDECHDQGEHCSALKANLLPLAFLGKPSSFFGGGRGGCHGDLRLAVVRPDQGARPASSSIRW